MGLENIVYPRPAEDYVSVTRQPVNAVCPGCGGTNIKRYPVSSYLGPKIVVKCQDCFYHLNIEEPGIADRWPPFRALAYDWQRSPGG